MNREFALAAADYVESVDPKHFDMEWWGVERDCGTVACLAGHICHFGVIEGRATREKGIFYKVDGIIRRVDRTAYILLGFDESLYELDGLFNPFHPPGTERMKNWSPTQAAQALREFVEERTTLMEPRDASVAEENQSIARMR